jgi:ABC-type spermidine/putrescine transport system permease subunit I
MHAIISVGITCFALGASAFVIPLILGRGQVSFVTNLIYTRFSEVANYPSGATLATLLLVGVLLVFALAKGVSVAMRKKG